MKENKLDKLITLLEKVSNKKVKLVIKESEIFKPVRINERLKERKEKFDSKCTFDHEKKILTYNGDVKIIEYNILLEFYKSYIVDVNGSVLLGNENLNSIDIKFGKVTKDFFCTNNNLTSLKNCPEYIRWIFDCSFNKLKSLMYCPKKVDSYFNCEDNYKQFTKQEVLKHCKVGSLIYV